MGAVLLMILLCAGAGAQEDEAIGNPLVQEGIRLYRAGQVEQAIQKLEQAVAENPQEENALNALAIIYSNQEKFDLALEYFDKAIAVRDRNFKAIFNKLNLLINLGRIDESIQLLRTTTEKYPDYGNAWVNLGALLMQLGRLDEALACIDKALALDSQDFDAHFKRGQILMLQMKYSEAKSAFENSARINPDFEPARRGIAMIDDILAKKSQGYIRVRQILVPTEAAARQIREQIAGGADFVALARRYSVDPTGKSGGNLGFVKRGELLKVIEDAIFSLEVGELSPVVRSPSGYHIFLRVE